jgi:hypothetical protein
MKKFTFLIVGFLVAIASQAQAALFLSSSYFNALPSTQATGGIISNTLALSDTLTGFNVAGQVTIQVNGPESGTLLSWEVLRPLDPSYGAAIMSNTSSLTGWINAPIGNGTATGQLLTEYTLTAGSTAISAPVPDIGPGITNFPPPAPVTTTFAYVSGGANSLRQYFEIDYNYTGAGVATYTIDFPAESITQPVPEPSTFIMLGMGLVSLLAYSYRQWK